MKTLDELSVSEMVSSPDFPSNSDKEQCISNGEDPFETNLGFGIRRRHRCYVVTARARSFLYHQAAVYGRDPNWGRIAAAAGYAGIPFHQNNLRIMLGDILLMNNGQPLEFDRAAASDYLRKAGETHGTVGIYISVGGGPGSGQAWGCDLSYDYVKINAEYTT